MLLFSEERVVSIEACRLAAGLFLLGPGVALRLRPRRYSSAGFRKIPVVAAAMSVEVPRSEDMVPVTGSQRRFSMRMGLLRYL